MRNSSFAAITGLALIFLALCCQVIPLGHIHDAMQAMAQPLAHALLLSMDIPTGVWLSAVLLLSLVLATQLFPVAHPSLHQGAWQKPYFSANFSSPPPLQLAFADGILHPKLY